MLDSNPPEEEKLSGWCPITSWTRVYQIRDKSSSKALEELCQDYRLPVFKAFRLKHHFSHEDAEDAVQEFFIWFLKAEFVIEADHTRGKFRTFLLTYLDNFAKNRRRKLRREKGSAPHLSIHDDSNSDIMGVDIEGNDNPISQIHIEWAHATLSAARTLLKRSEFEAGREEEWVIIRSFLSSNSNQTIESAANELGISVENMKIKIHRLRKKFFVFLSEQVSATVSTKEEFDQEMAFLREVFS